MTSSNVTRCPVQPRTPDDGYMLTETSSEIQTMTFECCITTNGTNFVYILIS